METDSIFNLSKYVFYVFFFYVSDYIHCTSFITYELSEHTQGNFHYSLS